MTDKIRNINCNIEHSSSLIAGDCAVLLIVPVLSLLWMPVWSCSHLSDSTGPLFDGNNGWVGAALCWTGSRELLMKGFPARGQSPAVATLGPCFSSANSRLCRWSSWLEQTAKKSFCGSCFHLGSVWVTTKISASNWKGLSASLKRSLLCKCYGSAVYSN